MEKVGMKIAFPIIVYVANVGAIFMAENVNATSWTQHIDALYWKVKICQIQRKLYWWLYKEYNTSCESICKWKRKYKGQNKEQQQHKLHPKPAQTKKRWVEVSRRMHPDILLVPLHLIILAPPKN